MFDRAACGAARPTAAPYVSATRSWPCVICIRTMLRRARQRRLASRCSRSSIISLTLPPAWPSTGSRRQCSASLWTAPLHHLLMRDLGFPIVATSGNISDEPIVSDDKEALDRLGGIADLFIVHDRPIVRPVDDLVARVVCGRELLLWRPDPRDCPVRPQFKTDARRGEGPGDWTT